MKTLPFLTALLMPLVSRSADLSSEKLEVIQQREIRCDYLLSHPEGDVPEKGWPLVVFLHGAGERGTNLNDVKRHGPPKLIADGKNIPAIVVAPQCPPDETWDPHLVKALTDKIVQSQKVDTSRVYLTGLSMGGFGTWATAVEYPETYAAISPICGGVGIRILSLGKLSKTPCWIFHGEDDSVVPADFGRQAAAALEKAGAPVKLTLYPGVGHDSWTRTYDDPEFWKWLLAQKR